VALALGLMRLGGRYSISFVMIERCGMMFFFSAVRIMLTDRLYGMFTEWRVFKKIPEYFRLNGQIPFYLIKYRIFAWSF
jgi:hypothetical protein